MGEVLSGFGEDLRGIVAPDQPEKELLIKDAIQVDKRRG